MNALLLSALCLPVLGFAWFHVVCRLMLNHRSCRNRAAEVAGALDLRFPSLANAGELPWLEVVETLEREFRLLRDLSRRSERIRDAMGGETWMLACGFWIASTAARASAGISRWVLRQAIARMWLATATLAECIGEYQPVRRAAAASFLASKAGGVR